MLQTETPTILQTTIAPDLLALLWALKIDTTGLAEMPLGEAGDAVRKRIERVLEPAADPVLLRVL
jgi:hypothetical protein